jgi:hypothetical protein
MKAVAKKSIIVSVAPLFSRENQPAHSVGNVAAPNQQHPFVNQKCG